MLRTVKLIATFIFFIHLQQALGYSDSTGIEKRGGRIYILHKVEAKETLYALSRRYNVAVDEIKKENPDVVTSGLQIGQLINIPAGTYKESSVKNTKSEDQRTHEVKPKETLYAISKIYNVSVDDIKKRNPEIEVTDLKIGQILIIPGGESASAKTTETAPSKTAQAVPAKTESNASVKLSAAEPAKPKPIEYHAPDWKPGEKISETGIAELIEDNSDTNKYLALHKYAPAGTIIQVTNESNGTTIFVRVIGTLPETGANDKTVLKISKKAFQKLAPTDKKARVQISFIP